MQWVRDYTPDPERRQLYRKALIITLVGNVFLAVSKGAVAYFSGSVAVYADAANSASDVLYSLLMVLGLWVAQRPPDLSHPQGHKRFEPLVGLAVAASMAFAGYEAAHVALERFRMGGGAVEPGLPTLVLIASAAVKGGMYVSIHRLAQALDSPTLDVTAQDNLSDVLTSSAAFIGVLGSKFVNRLLDPLAGFLVAAWIFRAAYGAGRENFAYLTGAGAPPDLLERIAQVAASVPGVMRVHQVIADHVGPQLIADVHVDLEEDMALTQAHAITDAVQLQLEALSEVDRAYVHAEPHEVKDWENIAKRIRALAQSMGVSAHDIWAHAVDNHCYVELHLEVPSHFSLEQAHDLATQLENAIRARFPNVTGITTHLEPMGNTAHKTIKLDNAYVAQLQLEVERVTAEFCDAGYCHQVTVHTSANGPMLSLHCTYPGNLSLKEAHDFSEALEDRLRQQLPSVSRFVIHIEPTGTSDD